MLIAIQTGQGDNLMKKGFWFLFFLVFISFLCNHVFALTVDFFDLPFQSNFTHSLRSDTYYKIFYLGQGVEGNSTLLLMFTNVDFENDCYCKNLCVYIIAKTKRNSRTFFHRIKKSVLDLPGHSFDVIKQGMNRFYLFSLVEPGLLKVYDVNFNFPSSSKKKAFLTVSHLQDLYIPDSGGATKCNQYVVTPHIFPGGNASSVFIIENDCKLGNKGKISYNLYSFHPRKGKVDFLNSYDPGEYEVFGNSFYLFGDNLLIILFDGKKSWRLQSNKCSANLNGIPLFLSYNWETKNVLLFVREYFSSVNDCTFYFYPLNPEFVKLISFCPNVNLVRGILYSGVSQLNGLYSLDIQNCILKKQESDISPSEILKMESLSLGSVKFVKPFVEHKEDVLVFEYNWQGIYKLGFVE